MPRPLDTVESVFHRYNRLGAMLVVQALHVEGPLDAPTLHGAVEALRRRHPLLRWAIEEEGEVARFVKAGVAPAVTLHEGGDWLARVHDALNAPFVEGPIPPWRIEAVRTGDSRHVLLLRFPHCLVDGVALCRLSRELVAFAADPAKAAAEPFNETAPEPLDTRVPRATLRQRFDHRVRHLGQRFFPPDEVTLPLDGHAPPEGRSTRCRVAHVAPGLLDTLRATARTHQTTVNGAISAAAARAVRRVWNVAGPLPVTTSADLRRRTGLDPEQLGCIVTSVETRHRTDQGFWALAQEVSAEVAAAIDRQAWITALPATRSKLPQFEAFLRALRDDPQKQGREGPLGLSNRGLFKTDPHLPLRVVGVDAFVSGHTVGNALSLLVNSTPEAGASLALSFASPVVSDSRAQAFLETVHAELADAVR